MEYKQKLLDWISYTKRKDKQMVIMIEKKEKYLAMSDDEFLFEYTRIGARYEHKKFVLSVIIVTTLITIIMDIWGRLYDFIFRLLMLGNVKNVEEDMIKVAEILVVAIMFIILIVGVLIIHDLIKNMYLLTKEKIFIEEIKELRKV
ncbi:hypothetical protein [Traorella massiliensis]|uniref:hypothetical protein n=1 Tax=Traorella massiliensis TaxID=1903263 RepID=UPI0008F941B1|nr:hypothetical protein [Traorella massiliensis]